MLGHVNTTVLVLGLGLTANRLIFHHQAADFTCQESPGKREKACKTSRVDIEYRESEIMSIIGYRKGRLSWKYLLPTLGTGYWLLVII